MSSFSSFLNRRIIVERRAYDVAILGHTPEAYFAAMRLRQARKSVLILERFHPGHTEGLYHLAAAGIHVPDPDAALTAMASASLPMWKQLFDAGGAGRRLTMCDSMDCGEMSEREDSNQNKEEDRGQGGQPGRDAAGRAPGPSRQGAAGGPPSPPLRPSSVGRVIDCLNDLGQKVELLSSGQLSHRYPGLELLRPDHTAAVYEDAASFAPAEAIGIARALARKAGCDVRHDAPLFGLRDKGGATFELRLADKMGGAGRKAADLILVEVEQLVVCGGGPDLLSLVQSALGVKLGGVRRSTLQLATVPSPKRSGAKVPLIRYHPSLDPAAPPRMAGGWWTGLPRVQGVGSSGTVGTSGAVLDMAIDPLVASLGDSSAPDVPPRFETDVEREEWEVAAAERRARAEASEAGRTMGCVGGAITVHAGGKAASPEEVIPRGSEDSSARSLQPGPALFSPDGRPLCGPLPGFEEGRVTLIAAADSSLSAPHPGVRFGPLLGHWGALGVLGGALPDGAGPALDPRRESLGSTGGPPPLDPWDALWDSWAAEPAAPKGKAKPFSTTSPRFNAARLSSTGARVDSPGWTRESKS